MLRSVAGCVLFILVLANAAAARPFTAKDLATLERVSDPHVSPDGRFVTYNVRSTDWEGNRAFNAVWVLERGAAGAPPRLIRDQEQALALFPLLALG
jgi:acylaminoacyl-peptidase